MGNLNEKQKQQLEMLLEVDRISKKHNIRYYLAYGTALGAVRHKGFIPWDADVDVVVDITEYHDFCKSLNREIDQNFMLCSISTDPNYDSLKARVALKGQSHHTSHVDIFPLVGTPNNKLGRWIFSKISYFIYRMYFLKKVDANIIYSNNSIKIIIAKIIKLLTFPIPARILTRLFDKLSTVYSIDSSNYLYNICGSYGLKECILKSYYGNPDYKDFEGYSLPVPEEWDKYLKSIYGDYMTPKKRNYV